jgi:hypothetical protein
MATQLGIVHNVEFSGCLPDEGVRSMYEACDAYICMSEHEGFCLRSLRRCILACRLWGTAPERYQTQ